MKTGDWETRGPIDRPYVEAYPRLFAQTLVNNWRAGRAACIWRDQAGAVAGRAVLDSVSPTIFTVDCFVYTKRYYPGFDDKVKVEIDYVGNVGSRQRAVCVCPVCGKLKSQLILRSNLWCCVDCSVLKNRSSLIGTRVRRSERLMELESLVGNGRPKHMQARRYEAYKTELFKLRQQVGPEPLVAHSGFDDVITDEWHAIVELPDVATGGMRG